MLLAAVIAIALAPLNEALAQVPTVGSVVNAASFEPNLAPGGIASVFGAQLTVDDQVCFAAELPLPKELCGTRVLVNEAEAAIFFALPDQLNIHIPVELEPGSHVQVEVGGVLSEPFDIVLKRSAPGLYTSGLPLGGIDDGIGFFALRDGSIPSEENPVLPGEIVAMFGTGWGPTDPAAETGSAPLVAAPMVDPVSILVGPEMIDEIFYAGLSPGIPGFYQANFVVAANLVAGLHDVTLEANAEVSNSVLLPVGSESQVLENAIGLLEEAEDLSSGVKNSLSGLLRGASKAIDAGADASNQLAAIKNLIAIRSQRGQIPAALAERLVAQIDRVLASP